MIFLTLVPILFALATSVGLLVWAAVSDFRSLKIPNLISGILPVLFLFAFGVASWADLALFQSLTLHLTGGAIMLVLSVILYASSIMGAGDSKLAAAIGIWVGLKGLAAFVFWMSLVGGLIGLATLVIRKRKPFARVVEGGWIDEVQKGRNAVPYGIALSIGALMSFYTLGYFDIIGIVSKISSP